MKMIDPQVILVSVDDAQQPFAQRQHLHLVHRTLENRELHPLTVAGSGLCHLAQPPPPGAVLRVHIVTHQDVRSHRPPPSGNSQPRRAQQGKTSDRIYKIYRMKSGMKSGISAVDHHRHPSRAHSCVPILLILSKEKAPGQQRKTSDRIYRMKSRMKSVIPAVDHHRHPSRSQSCVPILLILLILSKEKAGPDQPFPFRQSARHSHRGVNGT